LQVSRAFNPSAQQAETVAWVGLFCFAESVHARSPVSGYPLGDKRIGRLLARMASAYDLLLFFQTLLLHLI
jgi:hypothetical protein